MEGTTPEERKDPALIAEAKRLYELSDQGAWEDLPQWMQNNWLEAAKRERSPG